MGESGHISRRDLLRGALGAAGLLAVPASAVASGIACGSGTARAGTARAADGWRSPDDDLETALRAARWIRSTRIPTASGVAWPADPDKPESVSYDLYHGTPGVILFLLELHEATGDDAFLAEARLGADQLAASLAPPAGAGLYTGLAGQAFTLTEVWKATGDDRYGGAVVGAFDRVASAARDAGAGVEWSESADIISGTAGILLYLLYAARTLGDEHAEQAIALAGRAGRRLVELGTPAKGGLKWAVSPSVPGLYPNFSHGTAGVAYALATLYGVTADRTLLEAATAGAAYLDEVAVSHDGGCRVFHDEPGGENLFYLSWCHGGPGTARLFEQLRLVTGDERWAERVSCHARGVTQMGAPIGRSAGYWNNISQCCGNAGVGEFFLSLHTRWPDRGYLDIARQAADDMLRRATEAGSGLKWVQAENRVSPDAVVAQTGRMQGASGAGSFFLHLSAWVRGRDSRITLPDSPWA